MFKLAFSLKPIPLFRGDAVLEKIQVKLSKAQRIFVNRSLNMGNIRAIGFDMDHTLVQYNRENFESLAFRATLAKFIAAGYPEELDSLQFKPNSVIRGLLVDRERGNLLKVDGHKYVKVALHGKKILEKAERHQLYNAESYRAHHFVSVDTFFALSEVQLFTEIIEFMRINPGKIQKSFTDVYTDLRRFIDLSHQDGSIKEVVTANPEKFLDVDPHLADTLIRLLEGGKTLFVLTNSDWTYTNHLMEYLLSQAHPGFTRWQDYFHFIIVGAGKPGFFSGSQPFYEVVSDANMLKVHRGKLETNKVYHAGNAELFQHLTEFRGDEILYVGDHVYTDIIQTKGLFNWRTMLVVRELEHELPKLDECKELTDAINLALAEREIIDEELHQARNLLKHNEIHLGEADKLGDARKVKQIEKDRARLTKRETAKASELASIDERIKNLLHERGEKIQPLWGEVMKVGLERSRFAQQVQTYACLYSSKVTNLRHYSPYKVHTAPHDKLPHDL